MMTKGDKRRRNFAAKRGLGYIPLNDRKPGCSGHHVTSVHVIYMPDNEHKKIPHNVKTGYNIDMVNVKAFKHLFSHKEDMKLPFKDCQNIMRKSVKNPSKIL